MRQAELEHLNVTVSNPHSTAERLCGLFDWEIRWEGAAMDNGLTVHVGTESSYLAVYSNGGLARSQDDYKSVGKLNHVGVVVDDLDATEERVLAAGYKTHSHGDYEPGRRFYFDDEDGIEFEVVSYL